jgi:hypothetical protein
VPHRKQAAPPKARGRRTKELRKQARAQVQRVMRMSARTKKGVMLGENECDLLV